jgi:hypothetical protein
MLVVFHERRQLVYEKYKGRLLPGDRVLEEDMIALGVAPKQKSRARQGFQRSAEQAKLGKDRLVVPPGVSLDSKPNEEGKGRKKMEAIHVFSENLDLDPMLLMLLASLPPSGSAWSNDARQQWLAILQRALDLIYKEKPE